MISVFARVGRSWMRRGVQDFFLKRSVLLLKKGGGSLKQRCSGSLWTTATAGLCVAHLALTIGPFLTPPRILRNLKSLFHLLCTLGKFGLGIKVFQTLHLKIKVCFLQRWWRKVIAVWELRSWQYRSWWCRQTVRVSHQKSVSYFSNTGFKAVSSMSVAQRRLSGEKRDDSKTKRH